MALLFVSLSAVACSGEYEDYEGESTEEVGEKSQEMLTERVLTPSNIEIIDCKKQPSCWECGNRDGVMCCSSKSCAIVNKKAVSLSEPSDGEVVGVDQREK